MTSAARDLAPMPGPAEGPAPSPWCPACGYDRTGLAGSRACPECGADVPADTVVLYGWLGSGRLAWWPGRRGRAVGPNLRGVAVTSLVVGAAHVAGDVARGEDWRASLATAAVFVAAAVAIAGVGRVLIPILSKVRHSGRPPVQARLGPGGWGRRRGPGPVVLLPWRGRQRIEVIEAGPVGEAVGSGRSSEGRNSPGVGSRSPYRLRVTDATLAVARVLDVEFDASGAEADALRRQVEGWRDAAFGRGKA